MKPDLQEEKTTVICDSSAHYVVFVSLPCGPIKIYVQQEILVMVVIPYIKAGFPLNELTCRNVFT